MRSFPILAAIGLAGLLVLPPAARGKEGVLHLHGTPGARVLVDGRNAGRIPVVALRLPEGRHEVRVELRGYETLTRDLYIGPVRGESKVYYLHKKRRRDAAWRAAVLPGWGTRYGDKPKRGAFYTAAGAGALLYALYEDIRFRDKKSDYEEADRLYGEALTDAQITARRETREDAYDEMDASRSNRDAALLTAAAVYGLSLLDAVFLFPFGGDSEAEPFALRPSVESGGGRVRASLRMLF